MKDKLKDLFQERFQGHEAPVDPATWQVIEARMLTSAPATDSVNELFRERFQQHELNVDPSVWQGINTQLGHGAAAGGGFLGGFGWVAAGVVGLVVAGGLIIGLNNSEPAEQLARQETKVEPLVAPVEAVSVAPIEQIQDKPTGASVVNAVPAIGRALRAGSTQNTPPSPSQTPGPQEVAGEIPVADQTGGVNATSNEAEGVQIVNSIIEDITRQVENEAAPTETIGVASPAIQEAEENPNTEVQGEGAQVVAKPCRLFLQNTFTPNNDGINDAYVVAAEECITGSRIRVFSMQNNQLVFSTNNYEPWNGANCEDGWYMVAVESTTIDGTMISDGKVVRLNRTGTN